mmetsp:Transcript_12073/g.18205  ORF Transcript_12073/g.18205 Transcript_12073/m.18205 type:complete len:280 (+) Transcript_12073:1196-2035(+)
MYLPIDQRFTRVDHRVVHLALPQVWYRLDLHPARLVPTSVHLLRSHHNFLWRLHPIIIAMAARAAVVRAAPSLLRTLARAAVVHGMPSLMSIIHTPMVAKEDLLQVVEAEAACPRVPPRHQAMAAELAMVRAAVAKVMACPRVPPRRLVTVLARVTVVKEAQVAMQPLVVSRWYLVASPMILVMPAVANIVIVFVIWSRIILTQKRTSTALGMVKELLLPMVVRGQVIVMVVAGLTFLVKVWISAVRLPDRSFRLRGSYSYRSRRGPRFSRVDIMGAVL